MCHVLVVCYQDDLSAGQKRSFESEQRSKFRKKGKNLIFRFMYGNEENLKTKQLIKNYKRKHPQGKILFVNFESKKIPQLAMAI